MHPSNAARDGGEPLTETVSAVTGTGPQLTGVAAGVTGAVLVVAGGGGLGLVHPRGVGFARAAPRWRGDRVGGVGAAAVGGRSPCWVTGSHCYGAPWPRSPSLPRPGCWR